MCGALSLSPSLETAIERLVKIFCALYCVVLVGYTVYSIAHPRPLPQPAQSKTPPSLPGTSPAAPAHSAPAPASTTKQPPVSVPVAPAPRSVDPEALTTKTILRDADKTGEQVRNEKRDGLGVLRELEIVYTDRTVGTRYYDATGKLVKIKRTAGSGGTEGVPDAGGKYTKQWKQFNSMGVVIRDFTRLSDDHYKIRVYRADGTLHWESEVQQGTGQVFRMYHPDGKTVHLETEVTNLRTRLDIFETDGKLLYREKLKDPKTARFGDVVEYTGEVYDAAGKVRRRALSNEGPYSNWHATFTDVEELADDGTVTSSGRPVRFDDTDYRSKLKDAQLQRIIEAKAAAYKLKNRGGLDAEVQEQWIDEVLRD